MRRIGGILLVTTSVAVMVGCRGASPARQTGKEAEDQNAVATLYWAGKKKLLSDPVATNLTSIWAMEESKRLEDQTLSRLAELKWAMPNESTSQPTLDDSVKASLRSVMADILESECRAKVSKEGDGGHEVALAVKLEPNRMPVWRTDLRIALEHLVQTEAATKPGANWAVKLDSQGRTVTFREENGWAIIAIGSSQNPLPEEFAKTLKKDATGRTLGHTSLEQGQAFLSMDLDSSVVSRILGLKSKMPDFAVALSAFEGGVRTRAKLAFASSVVNSLPKWNIPTNLIHEPLTSFAAVRGIGPALTSLGKLETKGMSSPDQLFVWGQGALPFLTYAAAPMVEGGLTFEQFSNWAQRELKPLIEEKKVGRLETDKDVLYWTGFPFLRFTAQAVTNSEGKFLMVGFSPPNPNSPAAPSELFKGVTSTPNLVYYDWEITAARTEPWIYLSQLARVFGFRTQVPVDSAVLSWVKAVGPKLGNSVTTITVAGDRELQLSRSSTIGLSSMELQLLTDWLEAPNFPRGLFTLETTGSVDQHNRSVPAK